MNNKKTRGLDIKSAPQKRRLHIDDNKNTMICIVLLLTGMLFYLLGIKCDNDIIIGFSYGISTACFILAISSIPSYEEGNDDDI